MLQHVLIGLDGSPLAESIFPYVSALTKKLNTDVILLHVVPLTPSLQEGEFHRFLGPLLQQEEIQAYDYLERTAQRLVEAGLKVQCRVAIGDAAAEILHTAQQENVGLLALATHGRSGLQRWLYGSVAEEVLHTTHMPLLLVRPTEEQPPTPQALTQVVVPLDGSPVAATVLPVAEALAGQCEVPLVLLRVVEPFPFSFVDASGVAGVDYQAVLDSLQDAADSYLGEVAAPLREKKLNVLTEAPMGTPVHEIVRYNEEHTGSLVVMATHGRSGLTNVLLGSVARGVVRHGNTPALIVRPPVASEGA